METNLEKAKRLIKDNASIQGIELPDDGFIFKMLELAATPNETPSTPTPAIRCALVEIDPETLKTCVEMYKNGDKLTAIKWLVEEARRDTYTFGIKWANEYFQSLGLEKVKEQLD